MAYKNATDLVQDDTDDYVVRLPLGGKNCTVGLTSEAANHASAVVRLDASFDNRTTWKTSISLSNPSTTIGAAYLTTLATGASANTQDRVFGATDIRVVRTDGNGGACKIGVTVSEN